MTPSSLEFDPETALGRAFRIDTASVWAEAVDHELLTRVSVGSLVAFQGASSSEYLIGVLDRVTRDLQEEALVEEPGDEGEVPLETRQRDLLRVVLLGTYRTVDGIERDTFKRGADSYPRVEAPCWVVQGENLQNLMSLLSQQVPVAQRLTLGVFVADPSASAVADGNRLFQRHAALLGSTGSGKSWAVAQLLERAHTLDYPNLIVFDLHGEYAPLSVGDGAIASSFHIAGPSDSGDLADGILHLPWWLLNQDELRALLLDRSEDNAPNQAARLTHHVRELKHSRLTAEGRDELVERFTVDSPIPYSMEELLARLEADDNEMVPGARADKQGPYHGKLTRFIGRVRSRTDDRRFSFMFSPTASAADYDWLHDLAKRLLGTGPGIKIIDFSEVPSDVLPIIVGVLARLLYEIHFWTEPTKRSAVTLVCDEAHLYLPASAPDVAEARALDAFERIAKEGRKYGISLVIVSQRPSDVSRTILSQCNNFIVLRLTNDQDRSVVTHLMPDSMEGLAGSLPLLDVGEALLIGDAIVLPTRIRLNPPSVKPASATREFWTEWSTIEVVDSDLIAAVEAMRKQARSAQE